MLGELTIISPDGTTSRRALKSPNHYQDLTKAVGGGIDLVSGFTSFEGKFCDAYVNDESLLTAMPKSQAATEMWWAQLDDNRRLANTLSILRGPVAIVTGDAEFIAASR